MKKLIFLVCLSVLASSYSQSTDTINKMQWFTDAKLGIFIHWGIYSVNGVDESWSFHNGKISHQDYMKQLKGFTAQNYNPEYWADLIQESGAKYAVITSKHHDGVALFPTQQKHYSILKNTPAKQDVLAPFFKALEKRGIKKGVYFSLIDWSHPDYTGFLKEKNRYNLTDDPKRWDKFLQFCHTQITEVAQLYQPDLWWFDGEWEHSESEWQSQTIQSILQQNNPNFIANDRLKGFGNYETYEQGFPSEKPTFPYWETCLTLNRNWGYHPDDTDYKTPHEIISIFTEVISNGGVLLLDIGPREDGFIPHEQEQLLKQLGSWIKPHAEAIYETTAGIEKKYFYGATTLSKDRKTLYLFLPPNTHGSIPLKALETPITSVSVVGSGVPLSVKTVSKVPWFKFPGIHYIDVPQSVTNNYCTVIKVTLADTIRFFKNEGE